MAPCTRLRRLTWAAELGCAFALLLLLLHVSPCLALGPSEPSQDLPYAASTRILGDWIAELQFGDPAQPSFGGLRVHDTPALYAEDGTPLFRVVPYQASLSVLCLLGTNRPDRLAIARDWIDWYRRHMRANGAPRGVVYDHWYREDGTGETPCPRPKHAKSCHWEDASDSNAAVFLLVVAAYWREGGSEIDPETPGLREQLELAAKVILDLQDDDGLTLARSDYPVKYLMDNSETYAGLRAMAEIEAHIFGDLHEAQRYEAAAARVQTGIRMRLGSSDTTYRSAAVGSRTVGGRLHLWYPDTAALVWPLLFGVETPASSVTQAQIAALNRAWEWTERLTDPRGFPWSSVAYAHVLAGRSELARRHSALVLRAKLPQAVGQRNFDWPFAVDDAGWLLLTLRALGEERGAVPRPTGPSSDQ